MAVGNVRAMRVGMREAHLVTHGTGPFEHDLRVEVAITIEASAGLAIALAVLPLLEFPLLEFLVAAAPEGDPLPRVLVQSILESRARETLELFEIKIQSIFANAAVPEPP